MSSDNKNHLFRSYLLQKYDIPCPRYTSYPTVPFWDGSIREESWKDLVSKTFSENKEEGLSLYIHLPFCEKLCTYCACNKRITANHRVEIPYILSLLKEWKIYTNIFKSKPLIREIHLGGGTPTFFSPDNLDYLLENIFANSLLPENPSFSFEAHPSSTRREHLETLFNAGFRRISLGVQDFDLTVQKAIHRIQTFEETEKVIFQARRTGYHSINIDLIYGLPFQTRDSITDTISKVLKLLPERIAFYSYAHVPWKSKSQRGYSEENLPAGEEKRSLFEQGQKMLSDAGYKNIGMDHFSLPQDDLYKASLEKKLHRNFMGYTTKATKMLIGIGCSSISDIRNAFVQNNREVEDYEKLLSQGKLPVSKGHILSEEDEMIRRHIFNLMCNLETTFADEELKNSTIRESLIRLNDLEEDGLVIIKKNKVLVTETGKAFIRNICLCFDSYYWETQISKPAFSQSL
jgi:oxygen-independent coproporphyrinogen-3 oxidase